MADAVDRFAPKLLTKQAQRKFLDYVRDHPDCSAREACKAVRLRRVDVRHTREADAEFAADYHEARGRGPEAILAEIRRRAIEGVDEPVFQKGEQVGVVRRYSDRLLEVLGKAYVPELRETIAVGGVGGGPVEVTVEHDFGQLLDRLEQVGVIRRAGAAALDAAPHELQPARPD